MKNWKKRYLYLFVLVVSALSFTACEDDDHIYFYPDHPLYYDLTDGYWEIDFGEVIDDGEFEIDVVSVFEFNYDGYDGFGTEYIKDFNGRIWEERPFNYVVGEGYGTEFIEFTYRGKSQSEVLAGFRFSKYSFSAIHYDSFSDFKHDAYGNEWYFDWIPDKYEPVPTTRAAKPKSVRKKPIRHYTNKD